MSHVEPVSIPGCFIRIDGVYTALRTAEKRVADFIKEHPEELIHFTVTELADATATSESTVVRLCQKLGYKGYQEFKIMLARDLVAPADTIFEAITPADSIQQLKSKVFQANIQALKDTIEVLDDASLQRAADAIGRARRMDIYGVGGSSSIAYDAYHKFHRIGVTCFAMSDADFLATSARMTSRSESRTPEAAGMWSRLCEPQKKAARRRFASPTTRRRRSRRSPTSRCSLPRVRPHFRATR
jgi:DNA-binding MurR/RpiR family transcriptional regulator